MKYIILYEHANSLAPVVGTYATADDEDYIWLNQWTWTLNPHNGEAMRNCKGHPVYMQDAVWERVGRKGIPEHISENSLDNRRANLQLGIPALNTAYRRTVTWDTAKEMWRLETLIGGETLVGFFSTPHDITYLEQVMYVFQKSREPEPEFTPTVTRRETQYNTNRNKWIAKIEVNGIPIIVGTCNNITDARAVVEQYFTKEKP